VTALRKLEIEIPARERALPLPPLSSLVPVLDAVALSVAIVLSAGQPAVIACSLLTFAALNVDTSRAFRLDLRVGQEMGWLLGHVAVPLLIVVSLVSLGFLPWLGSVRDLDRIVIAGAVGAFLVLVGRAVAYAIARAARTRGLVAEKALIVGNGQLAVELADALARHTEYGLMPIGFVDGPTDGELPLPLLGGPHELEGLIEEFGVRRLVVAFGRGSDRELTAILRELEGLPVEVHIVPRFFELGSVPPGTVDSLRGIPLVHLRRPALRAFARFTKRSFDVAVASTILVACAPVLLVAAVAVRVSSSGPILFRQVRVGRRGAPFEMLKFRTMRVDDAAEPSWGIEEHRVTSVGRVLRRLSIDELPQLVNVIRGDMSLVGPRPELPQFVERFGTAIPGYRDRLRVHGGITGLAQIHGRSRGLDSIPERVRLDNTYIETRSLWGDIVILFRTLEVIFRGDSQDA